MKEFDLDKIYKARRERVAEFLRKEKIFAVVFEDTEGARDVAIRYLTGHPSDAILIITEKGESVLTAWDENLMKEKAKADRLIPYTTFERKKERAIREILASFSYAPKNAVVELPSATNYLQFKKYEKEIEGWCIECREKGAHDAVVKMRAVKDEYEIECTREACRITNGITDLIETMARNGEIKTETDVALLIERKLREAGCERTSFDTLAAGPARSFAIHAFPPYTNGAWPAQGLSILDYGVCYEGYASDATITIAKGKLTDEQEKQLALTQQAFDECLKLYKAGNKTKDAAKKADEIFASANRTMPHGLGHGTGLEIHEAPSVSMRADDDVIFQAGNIVTLEPGLYDAHIGGCRLENDVLITADGNEVLTNSRIIRID